MLQLSCCQKPVIGFSRNDQKKRPTHSLNFSSLCWNWGCDLKVIMMKRARGEVSIRSGQVEFVKVNTDAWKWRDVYRWLLGLSWPQFAAFVASLYVGLNVFFAALYSLQQDSIAGSTGGHWFFDCFFFSVQTLATVGYGHMFPQNLYCYIISTVEIMTGIFLLAAMPGLI